MTIHDIAGIVAVFVLILAVQFLGELVMDDLLDRLFAQAEKSPLMRDAAEEIFQLRKQVGELQETVEFEREELHRRWQHIQAAKYRITELERELALTEPGPDKTFRIIYSEHVGDKPVRSSRTISSEGLGACMAEGWLLNQFRQVVDEVRQPTAKKGE